ncbi:carboxymuconolactone decarboxylase family protein [Bacillus sp. PS06]|nr:carboxymuconolactone decarboxylase family protein [Bacillus sp. PS06]
MFSQDTINQMEGIKNISPDLWQMIVGFGFGDVYGRPGLSLEQKEIITLTTLITQGAFEQFEVHVHGALKVGLSKEDIIEIIIQCAAYCGFPKAVQAMGIAGKIFESYK